MARCLSYAVALAIVLLACAEARTLQQTPAAPPTTYTGSADTLCTVGTAGNAYCTEGSNKYECYPLKYAFPNGNYNDTAGACALSLQYTYVYTFKNFIYSPPDNSWNNVTQKAFVGVQTCNDATKNSGQACQLTYNKQTATSTSTTFTQSLALEADFTFKVGGCALCPAEADTTFKVTANFGFQENFAHSDTTGFSASLTSNPPPGNCTVGIFSVSYINGYTVSFEADVDATCKELINFSPFSVGPTYTVPCLDIQDDLKSRTNFTGTIQSIDPGLGFNQTAHIQLAGAQIVSFGTQVNSNVCDCNDQPCISKAKFQSATGQTNAVNVNPTALASGAAPQTGNVGKTVALSTAQQTCDNCTSIAAAPSPGASTSG